MTCHMHIHVENNFSVILPFSLTVKQYPHLQQQKMSSKVSYTTERQLTTKEKIVWIAPWKPPAATPFEQTQLIEFQKLNMRVDFKMHMYALGEFILFRKYVHEFKKAHMGKKIVHVRSVPTAKLANW